MGEYCPLCGKHLKTREWERAGYPVLESDSHASHGVCGSCAPEADGINKKRHLRAFKDAGGEITAITRGNTVTDWAITMPAGGLPPGFFWPVSSSEAD